MDKAPGCYDTYIGVLHCRRRGRFEVGNGFL